MSYQDYLDGSVIEETILYLLFQNKGVRDEHLNTYFFPYIRLLSAGEFLYLTYIAQIARNRISKKIENLISTFYIRYRSEHGKIKRHLQLIRYLETRIKKSFIIKSNFSSVDKTKNNYLCFLYLVKVLPILPYDLDEKEISNFIKL